MIVKISPERGSNMGGLVEYLFGRGRSDEHRDAHLVAAHSAMWLPGAPWFGGRGELAVLIGEVDGDRAWLPDPDLRPAVWHCSLANPVDDRPLDDAEWAQCALEMVTALGFTAGDGSAACQWFAVRHGKSTAGNDHIHIGATLVREDSSFASTWQDQIKASAVCARLELLLGLTVVEGRAGGGIPALSRAELERSARSGVEPERRRLARIVRGTAAFSRSEAEFSAGLRSQAQVRFRRGANGSVVGYSVALLGADGLAPLWFGGGKLGRDLTLPRVRSMWTANTEVSTGAVTVDRADEAWRNAAEIVHRVVEQLESSDTEDQEPWMAVSEQAAGVLAAWSIRIEGDDPGGLAVASDALAKSSQPRYSRGESRPQQVPSGFNLCAVAIVVARAPCHAATASGQDLLLFQLCRLIEAIERFRIARAGLAQSQRQLEQAHDALIRLHTALARSAPDKVTTVPRKPPALGVSGPHYGRDQGRS